MNTMIRFFSAACEAEQKQAMAFEISEFDERLLKFGRLFRERFMDIKVSIPLEEALDLCWQTLAECFHENELLMKQEVNMMTFFYNKIVLRQLDILALKRIIYMPNRMLCFEGYREDKTGKHLRALLY